MRWLSGQRAGDPREIFAADLDWDTGLEVHDGDSFFESLGHTVALQDIAIVDQMAAPGRIAIVFNASDPVTNLGRREAWMLTLSHGRVVKVRGASVIIPPLTKNDDPNSDKPA